MLSVVFLSAREMRLVNDRYRQRNHTTDVLSFHYEDAVMEELQFLGEILIAPEVAAEHMSRYRTSHEREVRKLLVHGILHLLGYDHEIDKGRMNSIQNNLLRRKILRDSPPLVHTRGNR